MDTYTIANLSPEETAFLQHMQRWGSDGYPVQRLMRGRFVWHQCFGIKGAPTVYKRKRDCIAAIEAYIGVLLDKHAGRL